MGQNSVVTRNMTQMAVLIKLQRIYMGRRMLRRSARIPQTKGKITMATDLNPDRIPICTPENPKL
jgi:hypothetical protein